MVLTNKKIYGLINEIAGERAVPIIEYLKNRKNVSEFIIADKVKLDMQTTRNILYTLNSHNVATYIRRKDRKKGWYISYWTFNRKRVKELTEKLRKEKIIKLTERLLKEESNKGNFFICTQACARLDFEQATEFEFKCPECGNLINQQDNTKTIDNIKERITELENFDLKKTSTKKKKK
jgi:transcription initiation factor TFIIE subunit alpha